MGRLYKRGCIWWIQYYRHGELFRESSRAPMKSVASALLKKREGDIADGRLPALQAEKTTFEDLARLYLQDYEINGKKTVRCARQVVAHLGKEFQGLRAGQITTPRLQAYITRRLQDGVANATINRALAALKRMFRLAAQQTPPLVQVTAIPHIPHLRENNVRQGFLTEEEYQVLRAALPDHVKVPFILAYWTGMRAGEILSLQWEHVDWERGLLRLEPGTTKNGRGRIVPLVEEVQAVLQHWREHTLRTCPACPWVCHYQGARLRRIPKRAWKTTCERIGLQGKLFHDLRRTAIRHMVRSGISEKVAMQISGHQTRSVFDRYDIVSETDLLEARRRLEQPRMSTLASTVTATELLRMTLSD
jgi:integrase